MFEVRNPKYAVNNVRNLASVRRAMSAHRKSNPACAWCGRTKGVHVHHIEPVSHAPHKAGNADNLLTLCGKRCHLTVGHFGNYKDHNPRVIETCLLGKLESQT